MAYPVIKIFFQHLLALLEHLYLNCQELLQAGMPKEDLQENSENLNQKENSETDENLSKSDSEIKKEETKELTSEDKIKELEDKVARTMAEMENQVHNYLLLD